jgi:hypothetical protein
VLGQNRKVLTRSGGGRCATNARYHRASFAVIQGMHISRGLLNKTTTFILAQLDDSTATLYPTTATAPVNRWTTHIRTTHTGVLTELECAAHASLYYNYQIDYYILDGTICYMCDFAYTIGTNAAPTGTVVRLRRSK